MPTIKDIAKAAGVSKATVSNVFNNKSCVKSTTRERVLAEAERIGFHPSHLAKSLATKRTNIAGYFLETHKEELVRKTDADMLLPILSELKRYGIKLLCYYESWNTPVAFDAEPIDFAFIFAPVIDDKRLEGAGELHHKKLIVIGRPSIQNDFIRWVDVNTEEMTRKVTQQLIELGHQHILFINSEAHITISQDRTQGYQAALAEANIAFDDRLVIYAGLTAEAGCRSICDVLSQEIQFDAVIASSDEVASGVYEALREAQLLIPEDVSVYALGGDDYNLFPKLCNVATDYWALGKEAVRLAISDSCENHTILDAYSMVHGASIKDRRN